VRERRMTVIRNYELEEEMFRSGPSVFFRARNAVLGHPVLVRRLTIDPTRAEDVKATFFREQRHAAALSHPHIQRPIDVMEEDGYLWAVSEFHVTRPTDELVREEGTFSVAEAARIGSQVTDALAHIHSKRIVHGKLAPPWILLDERRDATVINLVKSADLAAGIWPLRTPVLGLSPFTAPEEFDGHRPTPETDLYGLAATLVYWLTARYPRGGTTEEEATARAKAAAPPVDVRSERPDIPAVLADAIDAALQSDPLKRHGSAASLGSLLLEIHRRLAAEIPSGFDTGVHLLPSGSMESVELLSRHGSGAFGVVFRARARSRTGVVAVKALKPEHRADREARERFLREARALEGIDHPNVVRIRGIGEEGGTPFVVMDFIPGPDLGTLLLREGTLTPARASRLAAGVARGLEAIHREGIIHRDLKPHNILVAPGDRAVIADFGVARAAAAARLTMTGHFVGTPAYMAPEQFEDIPSTPAVDLYALGAILYETLTGMTPFPVKDTISTIRAIREDVPTPLPEDLPDGLAEITMRLLQKDPSERYPRASALAEDLEAVALRLEAQESDVPIQ
jgi:serine/threonine protein kinase